MQLRANWWWRPLCGPLCLSVAGRGYLSPEAGISAPRRGYLSRGGYTRLDAGLYVCLFRGGLSVPRRAYLSRGGPIRPEAGLSVSRRAYLSRGRPIHPYPYRGWPIRPPQGTRHCPALTHPFCSSSQESQIEKPLIFFAGVTGDTPYHWLTRPFCSSCQESEANLRQRRRPSCRP